MTSRPSLRRRLGAELVGSLLLATIVVGSGIAAQQLSPNDVGLQLAENAGATALGLFAIILMFGPVSGAHFNPVVSFVGAPFGGLPRRTAAAYLPAQVTGCIAGAVLANVMFGSRAVSFSTQHRMTGPHFVAEIVATAGLVLIIFALARTGRTAYAPAAVGAYIGAAYFFTSSTSFANPAITIGRMFSDTFAGIAPSSAPGYIAAQLIGGAVGFALVRLFYPNLGPGRGLGRGRPQRSHGLAAGIAASPGGDQVNVLSAGLDPDDKVSEVALASPPPNSPTIWWREPRLW